MNIDERKDYLKKYEEIVSEISNLSAVNGRNELICPKCGNKLVLRIAKKGSNAGNQFYGCSSYPKCKYIQNLS